MRIREIIIILGLTLSLILLGVIGFLNGLLDTTDDTDPTIVERDISIGDAVTHHLVRALALASEGGEAEIRIDSYDLNEILYALRGEMDFGAIKAISMYTVEEGDRYRLCLPVSLMGLRTMISGYFTIDEQDKTFHVTLEDITLGDYKIDSPICQILDVKSTVVTALNKQGIGAYFDGNVFHLRLTREQIGDMVAADLSKENDPAGGVINALYSLLMVRTDAVEIDAHNPDNIGLTLDLNCFGGTVSDTLLGVNSYVEEHIALGNVTPDTAAPLFKYYVNGYDRLTDEERAVIDPISGISPTGGSADSYGGLMERESFSLIRLLLTQLESNSDFLSPGFKVADAEINAMISDLDLVGMVFPFISYRDSSCAYVAIRDVYCNISDDRIALFVDLDLNGYILTISADFLTGESPLIAIGGKLNSIKVGNVPLNEEETGQIIDFIALHLQYDWIYIDKTQQTLTIDLSEVFRESDLLYAIVSGSKNTVTVCKSFTGDHAANGYIHIVFKLF